MTSEMDQADAGAPALSEKVNIDIALSSLEQMGDKSAYGPIVMKGPGLDAWNSAKDKS